jgi:hypothetical protein
VNVELQVKGRLLFTYPVLLDNGWSVLAHPGGSMETGGKTYNYLFWEGELNTAKADFSEAWEVHRNNLVSFLETKLGAMGLNTRETGDFITYWVPRMNANEVNEITFLVNEECDAYAKLNVSPAPDQVFRVFMVWRKGAEESDMEFKGRDLPVFRRDGFTVLEWGGSELKLLPVK